MKVLVLNSGAKDTVIAWWLSRSRLIEELYTAPGNPGTESYAVNLPDVDIENGEQVLKACRKYGITHVFIGTETPLLAGVADCLNANGIFTLGAPLHALKLDTDKKFAREFAQRCGFNIPAYRVFYNVEDLKAFLEGEGKGGFFTLKPNGAASSRTMINSSDPGELVSFATEFLKKDSVILEDHIDGTPVTITLLLDKNGAKMLPLCSEYSKPEHGEINFVTGGMGAVCPVPLADETRHAIWDHMIVPLVNRMKEEGLIYTGVLTIAAVLNGLTLYFVDFHLRLNDPAAQSILPLVKTEPVDIIRAMESNSISSLELEIAKESTVSVVIASEGYPFKPRKGLRVKCSVPQYLDNNFNTVPRIFLGAVKKDVNGNLITSGGRVATVVGMGSNITKANEAAYSAADSVSFKGSWYRNDIGDKFFISVDEYYDGE